MPTWSVPEPLGADASYEDVALWAKRAAPILVALGRGLPKLPPSAPDYYYAPAPNPAAISEWADFAREYCAWAIRASRLLWEEFGET